MVRRRNRIGQRWEKPSGGNDVGRYGRLKKRKYFSPDRLFIGYIL